VVHSRQRLYDVNHLGFARAVLAGTLNSARKAGDEAAIEAGFKKAFSAYTGVDHIVPLSRGRLAVYLSVKHTVTPSRRKVVMSPLTIFDVVNMVRVGGGVPEFIDTEPGTVHLSCRSLEQAIDKHTAAIVVTHYHSTNREIEAIAQLCRTRGVALIEDCAISLGGRMAGKHVGSFGDFALFSFGLFKFVSTYLGGGLVVRDPDTRATIEVELAGWPRMKLRDLARYAVKGLELSVLTNPVVFDHLTFPLFRFAYLRNLECIKKKAQNDPDPFLRYEFPNRFRRRPCLFQLQEFTRQIPLVEVDRRRRLENAIHYYRNFSSYNIGGLPEQPNQNTDCYLNFPIVVKGDRDVFVREMMKAGFDLSIYYYRNCAEIEPFAQYWKELPNVSNFVRRMVFFPVYPRVDSDYIDRLTKTSSDLLTSIEH